ncbi:MAG: DNA repair and recombination protein RadA [Nanoarchaeota archaeon]
MAKATLSATGKESDFSGLPGIGPLGEEKLKAAGYDTLMSLSLATPDQLTNETGMATLMANRIVREARQKINGNGFTSCFDELQKEQDTTIKIPTGSAALDSLLGGGVEIGSITEAYGQNSSGKTQLAFQLSVNLNSLSKDYVTAFIDTENTFKASRVKEITEQRKLNVKSVLNSIRLVRAIDTNDMNFYVEKIKELIGQGQNVKLVVIDSLMSHFRAEYTGRSVLAERQQKIAVLLHTLKKYARLYNFAVYLTNQVMTKPDQFFGDPTVAIGGNVVSHFSHYRLYLRIGRKEARIAKLTDSSNMPEGEACFLITQGGITDS